MSKRWMLLGGAIACVTLAGFAGLTAVAAHNFLSFSCKSKESEAKTNLAGLFTAEKAFYGDLLLPFDDLLARYPATRKSPPAQTQPAPPAEKK